MRGHGRDRNRIRLAYLGLADARVLDRLGGIVFLHVFVVSFGGSKRAVVYALRAESNNAS